MSYTLKPRKIIRELDFNKLLIGKELEVRFGEYIKGESILDPDKQKISADITIGDMREDGFNLYLHNYIKRNGIIDEKLKDTTAKWKVKDAYFVVHRNGGRMNRGDRPRTYSEFFNEEQKERYKNQVIGGTMGRILSASNGDMDRADVIVEFENDVKLDSMCFEIEVPEEWYSDIYKDNSRFNFADGFYESADKAIEAFSQKQSDDMFGARFFPVLVFDSEKVSDEIIEHAKWRPKASSSPIIKNGHIIIGTRCKPDEYDSVIEHCYENGGKVPIGVEWNW